MMSPRVLEPPVNWFHLAPLYFSVAVIPQHHGLQLIEPDDPFADVSTRQIRRAPEQSEADPYAVVVLRRILAQLMPLTDTSDLVPPSGIEIVGLKRPIAECPSRATGSATVCPSALTGAKVKARNKVAFLKASLLGLWLAPIPPH